MITRDKLEARREALRDDMAKLRAAIDQNTAQLHATSGAIQDVEHWLAELGPTEVVDAEVVADDAA